MFDVLVKGGSVLDGTGRAAQRLDVAVRGDRICAVGPDLRAAAARTVVDADGCMVCPGFIDVHSHSDVYLLIEPSAPSKIRQGVTTEVVGNCGASAAPLLGAYRMPSDWRDKDLPGRWSSLAEFRALLEQVRPAVNSVLLVGHNTLHAGVVGYEKRATRSDELRRMERLLEESLDAGARGLSTGLVYSPGLYASPEEVPALASVVARRDGIYATHMRSEGSELLEALGETLDIGRRAGVRLQVSHLKTSGRRNWPKLDAALHLIHSAQAEGIAVAADRYPYTAACTDLDVIFPAWAAEGGRDAVLRRLRDPAQRERLRTELAASRDVHYWESVMVGSTSHPDNARFRGRRLADVAGELGVEPVDAALHLIEKDELRTGAFFFGMCEENLLRILAEPYVMLGSDASIRAPTGPLSQDYPHPRAYGSFPRFLRMCMDGAAPLSLAEGVRKVTSLPADHFRLSGRGRVAEGMFADLAVFRPERVRERSTYGDPHQLAEGMETVIVNGVPALLDGTATGRRAGQVLDR